MFKIKSVICNNQVIGMYCNQNLYHLLLSIHMGHEEPKNYSVTGCKHYSFRFPYFFLVMQSRISVQSGLYKTTGICSEIFEPQRHTSTYSVGFIRHFIL